jgi:hypothetical protein
VGTYDVAQSPCNELQKTSLVGSSYIGVIDFEENCLCNERVFAKSQMGGLTAKPAPPAY